MQLFNCQLFNGLWWAPTSFFKVTLATADDPKNLLTPLAALQPGSSMYVTI